MKVLLRIFKRSHDFMVDLIFAVRNCIAWFFFEPPRYRKGTRRW